MEAVRGWVWIFSGIAHFFLAAFKENFQSFFESFDKQRDFYSKTTLLDAFIGAKLQQMH